MLRSALTVLFLALVTGVAAAQERVALVVGNARYATVGGLENATNDARLVGETLADVGFDVTLLIDADRRSFERAIADFGRALRADEDTVGLFYFAGHGVQSFGWNYLLPVDVALSDQADLSLAAIDAQAVLRQMFTARNRTNIVILDACRDNPFESVPDFDDNGLAEMKAPTGTYLAYSTAPGAVAEDGTGANSPFTEALAREIVTPGIPIEQVFKNVRVSVLEATGGRQTPWDTSSLTGNFSFVPERAPTQAELEELQLWRPIQRSRDPVQAMLFLRAFPNGRYAAQARALITEAVRSEVQPLSDAPSADPEPADPVPADPVAEAPTPSPEPTPPPEPGAEVASAEGDVAAFEAARATGTVAAYRAYLQDHPQGIFVEMARIEIAALATGTNRDPDGPAPQVAPEEAPAPAPSRSGPPAVIAFDDPVLAPGTPIDGQTIAGLIEGSPLHSPVENLPPAFWESETCGNCHQWTRERLCDQGNFYVSANAARNLEKLHPYGGAFKRRLRDWAEAGCK